MIDFKPTEAMNNIRQMVSWFAKERIRPVALEADRNKKFPESFLKELSQVGGGLMGGGSYKEDADADGITPTVKDDKGAKSTNRTMMVAVEELAWGDPSVALSIPGPGLGGPPVQFMGTPEQRKRYLGIFSPGVVKFGAYGLTEPGAGSDVSGIQTTAVKDGDAYILNGTKCFITNGASADWNVVFATVDKSKGRAGHRAFMVEKGMPGFNILKIEDKLGLRASETAMYALEDCRVPMENLLGGEEYYEGRSEGFKGAMKTFDTTRPLVAVMAVGIARGAFEIARDFVKSNYDLARPIPRYIAIREQMARMEADINAGRMLCWRSAWMADLGLANSKEASMAKVYCAGVAQRATQWAVEVMGPHGVLHGNMVEKFYRDQKVYDIFEGTGQVQRIVISRRMFS